MKQYVVECRELGIPYLYDPSQQIVRLTDEELQTGINGALALFVNDYEFGLVQKMTGKTTKDLLQSLQFMVVTCGKPWIEGLFKGSGIFNSGRPA